MEGGPPGHRREHAPAAFRAYDRSRTPQPAERSARNPVPSFELHRSCAVCTTSVERHAPISCKPLITLGCVVGIAVALQVAHDGSRSAPKRLGLGAGHRSIYRATQGRTGQSAIRMRGRELPRERPVPERASAFAEVRVLAALAAAAWAGVRSGLAASGCAVGG